MEFAAYLRSLLYGAGIVVLLTASAVDLYLLRTVQEANQALRTTNEALLASKQTIQATTALVNNANQQIASITNKLNAKLDDFGRVLYSVDGTVANVRKASAAWKSAADAQADATTQAAQQIVVDLKDADRAVNDIDLAVNQTSANVQPVVVDLATAAKGLSKVANDPALTDTVQNLDHTSHDFVVFSDLMVDDGKLADKRFRQMMKPLTIGQKIMGTALHELVPALEGWYYGRQDF